jgi:cardiolipin synthase
VACLERAFAGAWDEAGQPLPGEERPAVEGIPFAGDEAARVAIQEPRKMRVLRMLGLITAGVRRRLWITDAYFLSVPVLTQARVSNLPPVSWCYTVECGVLETVGLSTPNKTVA